jgi:hypothetical protein
MVSSEAHATRYGALRLGQPWYVGVYSVIDRSADEKTLVSLSGFGQDGVLQCSV